MFAACSTASVQAQSLPTTIDPGRVQQDIERGLQAEPLPETSFPRVPRQSSALDAPEGAEDIFFEIKTVILLGNEHFKEYELSHLYQDLLYKEVPVSTIYEIANRISQFYWNNGFLLSRAYVPEQELHNGIVTIRIVEGTISSFEIQGAGNSEPLVAAYAKKLIASGPITSENLERYLMLMNDIPGTSVRSVLVPSTDIPDSANIILSVTENKLQGYGSIDNFGNTYLGPERITLSGQANNIISSSDQTNLIFLTAPNNDELYYYNFGFHHNIGSEGTKAGFNISYARTNPSLPDNLGGLLEPEGEATTVSFDVRHPFIRSRKISVYGGLSFDITKNKTDYAPGLSAIETDDHQRILRTNTQITYIEDDGTYNGLNAILSHGLDMFGASKKGSHSLSRWNGDPNFTKVSFDASRISHIKGPFSLLTGLTGQYSFNNLLSSEQFSLGGNEFGRGYDSSEITGDHGLGGKVELIYNKQVDMKFLQRYQIYSFYDVGKVWRRGTNVGEPPHESLASTGIGSRIFFTPNLRGEAYIAKPLTHKVSSRGDRGKDPRFRFSLTTNF